MSWRAFFKGLRFRITVLYILLPLHYLGFWPVPPFFTVPTSVQRVLLQLLANSLASGLRLNTAYRGLDLPAFAPERPLELQTFPALQDLRLENIPLEHIQGGGR